MIQVIKYVITERNSEIGYQFAAAVLGESGKQRRYHAERYVCKSLEYAYIYVCTNDTEVHRSDVRKNKMKIQ